MPGDATTKRAAGHLYKLLTDKKYLPTEADDFLPLDGEFLRLMSGVWLRLRLYKTFAENIRRHLTLRRLRTGGVAFRRQRKPSSLLNGIRTTRRQTGGDLVTFAYDVKDERSVKSLWVPDDFDPTKMILVQETRTAECWPTFKLLPLNGHQQKFLHPPVSSTDEDMVLLYLRTPRPRQFCPQRRLLQRYNRSRGIYVADPQRRVGLRLSAVWETDTLVRGPVDRRLPVHRAGPRDGPLQLLLPSLWPAYRPLLPNRPKVTIFTPETHRCPSSIPMANSL